MLYDVLNTVAARSTLERWIHVKAFIPDWYHLLNLYHTQRRRWGKQTSWGGIFFFFLRQLRSGFFQKGLQLSADLVQSDLLKISWHDPRGERWLIVTPPPLLVEYRCEPGYKCHCGRTAVPTSNHRKWHHAMRTTPAQLFSRQCLSLQLLLEFSQLFVSHSSVFSTHHTLSYWFYFFISTSLSLAVSTAMTLIKFVALTRASRVMLNPRQCSIPQGESSARVLHFIKMPVCLNGSPGCIES